MGPADEGGSLRILLVDDNLDHAKLAMRALRAQPEWTIDVARLGQECLLRANEGKYDLVLLDYRLPDMTGLEVLARLRDQQTKVDVILMTSQGSEEVAVEALDLGAVAYVVKNQEFGKRLVYEVREWAQGRSA